MLNQKPDSKLGKMLIKKIEQSAGHGSGLSSEDQYGTWAPADPYSIEVDNLKQRQKTISIR